MKIKLVKEYKLSGRIEYYVTLDGELIPETLTTDIFEAQEVYERVKLINSVNRFVVLIEEEI